MTREQLESDARLIAGAEIETLPKPVLEAVITSSQYITDRCLAEIEKRGELQFADGNPIVPYVSDHAIASVLTREAAPEAVEIGDLKGAKVLVEPTTRNVVIAADDFPPIKFSVDHPFIQGTGMERIARAKLDAPTLFGDQGQ